MRTSRSHRRGRNDRRGLAVVETAFAVPLVLFLTFATLDICDGIFLRQKAELAAYEGAREAILVNSTTASVEQAVQDYLDVRGLNYTDISSVVQLSSDPDAIDFLEPLTVEVLIDLESNRRLPLSLFQFVNGPFIVAEVTMYKENNE